MKYKQNKNKSQIGHYLFVSKPSDGAFIVNAPGAYIASSILARLTQVDHQVVVDQAMTVPRSMRDLLIVRDGNEGLNIHISLLPEFGIAWKNVEKVGGGCNEFIKCFASCWLCSF